MELRIEHRAPTRIAYIAGVGAYSQVLPASFARLRAFAGQRGLFARPGAVTLAVCHDDPETTPAAQIRSEAAITVDDAFRPEGEVRARDLPGGKYAVATHVGAYDGLAAAWQELCGRLIPAAGLKFRRGEYFEVYVDTPTRVPADAVRTDLHVPVE